MPKKQLKAHRIMKQIDDLYGDLRKHQEKCKHTRATMEHTSDTGNWCKADDRYWTTFTCPTCLKIWTLDGSH